MTTSILGAVPPVSPILSRRTLRHAALAAVVVVACLFFAVAPAGGHGELVVSSPGPGETVGRASHIDLIFTTEVFDWTVEVDGPDGSPVRGTTVQKAPSWLSFEAVPLSEAGQYIVRYSAVDDDDDLVEGAYAFSFEEGGPAPSELPDDLLVLQDDSGWPLWWYGVLLLAVMLIAVLAGLLAEKLRRLRAVSSAAAAP